ncbi:MAG: hypothetical protein JJE52_02895 [Acidimicrobiia bacterium]|nr:hypothetical protein [Acidimicrobiia bacterium]
MAAVVVAIALVGLLAGIVVGAGSDTDASRGRQGGSGLAAAPVDLADVPDGIAGHYEAAAAEAAAFAAVPCFCGCEEFLGHRSLYDCFVRTDGDGWDAHAAGCGVCIGESTVVRALLDEGEPASVIRAAVIDQFGSTPTTTPPPS